MGQTMTLQLNMHRKQANLCDYSLRGFLVTSGSAMVQLKYSLLLFKCSPNQLEAPLLEITWKIS